MPLRGFRERFLSPSLYEKRALTTESTEVTEIFNSFFWRDEFTNSEFFAANGADFHRLSKKNSRESAQSAAMVLFSR